jgi:hypothetical protein
MTVVQPDRGWLLNFAIDEFLLGLRVLVGVVQSRAMSRSVTMHERCGLNELSTDQIIQMLSEDDGSHAAGLLRAGQAIYVTGGDEFPGKVIRISPDGTRHLVRFDFSGESIEQEISPVVPTWFRD